MEEHKLNRMKTAGLMHGMVDKYWEDLRLAHDRGQKVVWMQGMPMTMLAAAMDLPVHFHPTYSAYVGARRLQAPLLEAAAAGGLFPDVCSYIRLHVGLISLTQKGLPIPEEARVSLPDLIITGRFCTEHSTLGELVQRMVKCPIVVLDLSPAGLTTKSPESEWEKRVTYVERQIREEAIPAIEKLAGRPYDYDRLSEMLDRAKRVAIMRDQVLHLMENRPSPCSLFDIGVSLAPLTMFQGSEEAVDLFVKFKAEAEERVRQGVGAVTGEKYRLYWDGYTPWRLLGTIMRMLVPYGAIPLAGRYPIGHWYHPESIEPERPLRSLAYQTIRWWLPSMFPGDLFVEYVMDWIQTFSLDGLIMSFVPPCRLWNMGIEDVVLEAEKRHGIPGILLSVDPVDPQYWNEADAKRKFDAFFEMLEARKRG